MLPQCDPTCVLIPPQLESAALRLARQLVSPADEASSSAAVKAVPEMQVTLKTGMNMLQFRELSVSFLIREPS
jgi:DNA replication licensing factor MCM5